MITNPRSIELLIPAKNVEIGIAAIDHGADAVYIGPPNFGARAAASNTLEDIQKLVDHAHKYYAKVYVTLNTILVDSQIESAETLIHQLYEIGVDALIIQDMSILKMDIPPIELHASTQCNTQTVEDVQFLESCGFQQIVVARETSLKRMKDICQSTSSRIEAFIHGALCVSYSGQCYISEASRNRSANRGACAQMCRLPYNLVDQEGTVLVRSKHLLSLKDFDASSQLEALLDSGVSSLKVEGRLKDIHYVKNITSYYRRKLDAIFQKESSKYIAASSGRTTHYFTPNPQKTFYRGSTDYFLNGRNKQMQNMDSPKSLGEPIGRVKSIFRSAFTIKSSEVVVNGDGFCYLDHKGKLQGFRINKVEDKLLFPLKMPRLEIGQLLYRNQDVQFEKTLNGKSSERKIPISIVVTDHLEPLSLGEIILSNKNSGQYDLGNQSGQIMNQMVSTQLDDKLYLVIEDSDSNRIVYTIDYPYEIAKNKEKTADTFERQLAKLGNTEFFLDSIRFEWNNPWFIPASVLTDVRRQYVHRLQEQRKKSRPVTLQINKDQNKKVANTYLDYKSNISNNLAKSFYLDHGAKEIKPAFELRQVRDAELMRCKYCIRYALGWCKKEKNDGPRDPLFLINGSDKFALEFDCHNCEMVLKASNNNEY